MWYQNREKWMQIWIMAQSHIFYATDPWTTSYFDVQGQPLCEQHMREFSFEMSGPSPLVCKLDPRLNLEKPLLQSARCSPRCIQPAAASPLQPPHCEQQNKRGWQITKTIFYLTYPKNETNRRSKPKCAQHYSWLITNSLFALHSALKMILYIICLGHVESCCPNQWNLYLKEWSGGKRSGTALTKRLFIYGIYYQSLDLNYIVISEKRHLQDWATDGSLCCEWWPPGFHEAHFV